MKKYAKKLESIKNRLAVANHQRITSVINDNEYKEIIRVLEKEVRDLENKIFNDTNE